MDKATLLNTMREQFVVFDTRNSPPLPRYRGLTELLDAMVQLIDGTFDPGGPELAGLKQQLADLAARVDAIVPGMPEAEVRALLNETAAVIRQAIDAIQAQNTRQDTELSALRNDHTQAEQRLAQLRGILDQLTAELASFKTADAAHETRQNDLIEQLRQQLAQLPGAQDIFRLNSAIDQVQTALAAHQQDDDARDARQDGELTQLRDAVAKFPAPEDVSRLLTDLIALRDRLNAHLTQDDARDARQDADLTRLRADFNSLPSPTDLNRIISDLGALRTALQQHTNQDDARDARQDAELKRLANAVAQLPVPETIGQLLTELAALRDRLTAHLAQDDARDTRQDDDIRKLRADLGQFPQPQELGSLLTNLAALRDKLDRHLIQDDGRDARQDAELKQLRADLAKIPSPESLASLLTDLGKLRDKVEGHLAVDDARDARQEEDIKALVKRLDALPALADITGLVEGLRQVQAKLQTHLIADDARNARQDKAIDGLTEDVKAIPVLKNELLTARTDIAANFQQDERQDWAIRQLQDDLAKLPSLDAINQLLANLNALRSAFESHKAEDDARDARQDREIDELRKNPGDPGDPTTPDDSFRQLRADFDRHKEEDDRRDQGQTAAIASLRKDLNDLPGRAELERVVRSIEVVAAEFNAYKNLNDSRYQQQQSTLDDLSAWRQTAAETLRAIQARLAELQGLEPQLELLKDTLNAELQALAQRLDAELAALKPLPDRFAKLEALVQLIQAGATEDQVRQWLAELRQELAQQWNAELAELKPLPARITELEALLNAINPGISEERARQLLDAAVQGLRTTLEGQLAQQRNEQNQTTHQLAERLGKAEADIVNLFRLVGSGDSGNEVSEDYVRAEIQRLDRNLRDLVDNLDRKYEGLLGLAAIVGGLQTELSTRPTTAAVSQLIQQAVAGLASAESLTALESRLQAQWIADRLNLRNELISQFHTECNLLISQKWSELDGRLDGLATRLQTTWEGQLAQALAAIWEALPDQTLPEGWIQLLLDRAAQLDTALAAGLEARITLLWEQTWQQTLLREVARLDAELEARLLADATTRQEQLLDAIDQRDYLTTAAWTLIKVSFKQEIENEIQALIQALPPVLTPAEVAELAREQAAALDNVLSAALDVRLKSLEELNLKARLQNLEDRQQQAGDVYNDFVISINSLNLVEVKAIVNRLESWRQSTNSRLDKLDAHVQTLSEDIANSADSAAAQRLARLCLDGWGIAAGLEVYSDKDYCIHISPGRGVTPDGQLVVAPEPLSFIGYRMLAESEKKNIEDALPADIPVWALIPFAEEKNIDGKVQCWLTPQTNQERDKPFIVDKVVVLLPNQQVCLIRTDDYLRRAGSIVRLPENERNRTKFSDAKAWTTHWDGRPSDYELSSERLTQLQTLGGQNEPAFERLRQLAGGDRYFEYADYLFGADFSPEDNLASEDNLYRAFHPALSLKTIPLYRFGFMPGDDCTTEELDATKFPAIAGLQDLYTNWKPIVDLALNDVNDQLGQLLNDYHAVLFPQLPPQAFRNKLNILLANWKAYTRLAERKPEAIEKCYIQYFYDWARDLITAYHECRDELRQLMREVLLLTPEAGLRRPRRLMLGPAFRPDQDGLAAPLRDDYRQPPVYNGAAARWEKTRLYYRRLFELIESFYLPEALPNDRLPARFRQSEDDPFAPDFSRIRITPGRRRSAPLGQQTIPFYYPLTVGAGSLHHYWDYQHAKNRSSDQLLSYHASDYDDSYNNPADWHVTRPLYFNLNSADFYHIEGFIGKADIDVKDLTGAVVRITVEQFIRFLIQKHNLDLAVKTHTLPPPPPAGIVPPPPPDPSKLLTEKYTDLITKTDAYSFLSSILGAEHLGGAPRGGTFIVVLDTNGVAVADFCVPYRIP